MTRILRTGNGNRAPWLGEGLRPTLRDETAKDGAPGLLWLVGERRRQRGWRLVAARVGCLGEFLKGYMRKKLGWGWGGAGYSQDGDSRGLAQACDKATGYRSADQRC
jgi:hypothetical protein